MLQLIWLVVKLQVFHKISLDVIFCKTCSELGFNGFD